MPTPAVSPEDWRAARLALLDQEKAHTRARDALARARRALPRLKIDKPYRFRGATGDQALADLFAGRPQLVLYHFMFGADWAAGCPMCSFWADTLDGLAPHLGARGVTLALVSTAPFDQLAAYRDRMGWTLPWVSCAGGDFNHDMGVTFTPEELQSGDFEYNWRKAGFQGPEAPGLTVFEKDPDGAVWLTYAAYGRGLEDINAAYRILDLVPQGRDEGGLPFPMAWVRRHDEY